MVGRHMTKQPKQRKRGGASVPCPKCLSDTRVLYTRRVGEAKDRVVRGRECLKKKHRFETLEVCLSE